MQKVLVDFSSDTVTNLDTVSQLIELKRNELIRRGAEAALILSNASEDVLAEVLKEKLFSARKVLSDRSPVIVELNRTMEKVTTLSSALAAISIVNRGKASSDAIAIYANSMAQHLDIVSSESNPTRTQVEALKVDLDAYTNLVTKLYDRRAPLTAIQ